MLQLSAYMPSVIAVVVLAVLFFSRKKSGVFLLVKKYLFPLAIAIFFTNGLVYLYGMPYWNPIDEGSHFAYIDFLAKEKRLPLLSDRPAEEVLAIAERVYPDKPKIKPEDAGLAGYLYEAFQPPLYYLTALPFYWMGGDNLINKLYVLRFWNLLQFSALLMVGYFILQNIRTAFPRLRLPLVFFGLTLAGFIPSLISRGITIGNSLLSILFASLVFWLISKLLASGKKPTAKNAGMFGIFTSLAILAKFSALFLMPVVIIFLLVKSHQAITKSLLYLGITGIMLLPWLAFNKTHYGSFTANTQAREQQEAVVNPTGEKADFNYFQNNITTFMSTIWIPEETNWQSLKGIHLFGYTKIVQTLNVFLLVSLLLAAVISLSQILKNKNNYFFIVGFACLFIASMVGQQFYAAVSGEWPVLMRIGRYVHPAIFPIAVIFVFLLERIYTRLKVPKIVVFLFCLLPIALNVEYISTLL